jgi:hypothetical protein
LTLGHTLDDAMNRRRWTTKDGYYRVEPIVLNGRPTLRVSNKYGFGEGYFPTQAAMPAKLGLTEADLVPVKPESSE